MKRRIELKVINLYNNDKDIREQCNLLLDRRSLLQRQLDYVDKQDLLYTDLSNQIDNIDKFIKSCELDYRKLLLDIVEVNNGNGFSISDLERILELRKLIRNSDSFLLLDEHDYQFIISNLDKFRFNFISESIIQFKNDIVHAQQVGD